MKSLETLPQDIYDLFSPDTPHYADEEKLEAFASTLKDVFRTRLAERKGDATIRFSNLGRPDRQVWMSHHPSDLDEKFSGKTLLKFMLGDVYEAILLYLAEEAGHTVEDRQKEVSVDGIKGHIDAKIDGVIVDVKTASSFGFKKFRTNDVVSDDPFGYVAQLAGYAAVETPGEEAAWFAADKSNGSLCISKLSSSVIKDNQPGPRIEHLKEVVASDEPPGLCYAPVPDGASGNLKLDTGCSYCAFKKRCFPGLRTFLYSGGPRYLTRVMKEPNVPELFDTPPEEVND